MRFFILVIIGLLTACAGPKLPGPNSASMSKQTRSAATQVEGQMPRSGVAHEEPERDWFHPA